MTSFNVVQPEPVCMVLFELSFIPDLYAATTKCVHNK